MSRFRFYILPRLLLALSVLALTAGLWVLWLSLGQPMPTASLACRQAETARFLAPGQLLATGEVHLDEGYTEQDAWAVLRRGEGYALAELERRAGLLWTVDWLWSSDPVGSTPLVTFATARSTWWDPGEVWRDDYDIGDTDTYAQLIPLAVCDDPAAVRLEGELVVAGGWEAPQAVHAERAVPITWSPAENGVWVGEPVSALMPHSPDDPTVLGGSILIWCRAYDADGNLIASCDPSAR